MLASEASFSASLRCIVKKTTPKTKKKLGERQDWWTTELESLLSSVRCSRRHESNEIYQEKAKVYVDKVMKAKQLNWNNFISSIDSADDAYIRYKILCKPTFSSDIGQIKNEYNELSENKQESLQLLLLQNFPDPPAFPSHFHFHLSIEELVDDFLAEETTIEFPEPKITETKIIIAVNDLKPNKSPVSHELPALIYKNCIIELLPTLLPLFNKSIEEGCRASKGITITTGYRFDAVSRSHQSYITTIKLVGSNGMRCQVFTVQI
jgi:hypothetical protein